MAPRRPRKNDEAVESLIRNPSSKTDFRSIGNQQVRINLMFPTEKCFVPWLGILNQKHSGWIRSVERQLA